jgi:succinyl-diaminopimelate desuccinylase
MFEIPSEGDAGSLPATLDAVKLAQHLIAFDTINPPGRERICAESLADLLSRGGFAVTLHSLGAERASLVAKMRGRRARAPLVFTGHIDVVPLGSRKWRYDPFGAEIADGRLYGRGSSDMKSGVAAFVVAAIAEADRLNRDVDLTLVITAGEETGCDGAAALAAEGVLGAAGALIVAEPTANVPYVGHKGALWLKAITSGITAHGSMPEQGDNAVYKAARVITRLSDFDFNVERHPVLGKPTINVGSVHGGLNINSVPDRAEIEIDIRTVPGVDHGNLKGALKGYMEEDVQLDVLVDLPGVWTRPDLPWVARATAIADAVTGLGSPPRTAAYFTDASVLTPALGGVPTVILGPGEPTQAHQTDEWCEVARIPQSVTIYRSLIADWMERTA